MAAVTSRREDRRHDSRLRRVSITWAMLVLNVLTAGQGSLLPIPHRIAQIMTQGTLFVALVLAVVFFVAYRGGFYYHHHTMPRHDADL